VLDESIDFQVYEIERIVGIVKKVCSP